MHLKPISEIKVRLGINPDGETQAFLTNTCYKHMDKYVPKDSGALRQNVSLTKKTITYKSPYAHYMYIGKTMGLNIPIKDENGNITGWFSQKGKTKHYTGSNLHYRVGGAYWDKKMVSAEINDVCNEVQDFIRSRK